MESNEMIIEYDNFAQTQWIQKDVNEAGQRKFRAEFEAWKLKNGLQDGRYPSAKELANGARNHNSTKA